MVLLWSVDSSSSRMRHLARTTIVAVTQRRIHVGAIPAIASRSLLLADDAGIHTFVYECCSAKGEITALVADTATGANGEQHSILHSECIRAPLGRASA